MRHYYFVLILLILSFNLKAQETCFPYLNLKGSVKKVTTNTFEVNSDGTSELLSGTKIKWHFERMYLSNEDLPFMSEFFITKWSGSTTLFNDTGKATKHTAQMSDRSFAEWVFKYDSEGKVYSEDRIWISDNSKNTKTYLYKYNSNNKLRYKVSSSKKEYFIWNGDNVYEEFTDDYRIIYCYSKSGNINTVVVIEYGRDENCVMEINYSYDENGNISSQTTRIGNRSQYWEFEYAYDYKGNWIRRNEYTYDNGLRTLKNYTVRDIVYY